MAQVIGYIAMAIALCSFQSKTQKGIVIMQTFSTMFFMIHFFMLEAYSGAILNGICMVRAIVFTRREKKWAAHPIWIGVFIALTLASYLVTVIWLIPDIKPGRYFIELLPTVGNIITTFATRMKEAKLVRRFSLMASPLWLVYNIISGSIGGAVTEVCSSASILIGMLRLDIKKK